MNLIFILLNKDYFSNKKIVINVIILIKSLKYHSL
jgi:hypothetical protein